MDRKEKALAITGRKTANAISTGSQTEKCYRSQTLRYALARQSFTGLKDSGSPRCLLVDGRCSWMEIEKGGACFRSQGMDNYSRPD